MPSGEVHLKRFLADVRLRVRELAERDYAGESDTPSVDYVLLFIPNEQLTGFIHEHDGGLIDEAMGQKVVLCSPLTLFAFLGVIRQAFESLMVEQTSHEILQLLGTFSAQWRKYNDQVDSVKKKFDQVDRAFEQLTGPGGVNSKSHFASSTSCACNAISRSTGNSSRHRSPPMTPPTTPRHHPVAPSGCWAHESRQGSDPRRDRAGSQRRCTPMRHRLIESVP